MANTNVGYFTNGSDIYKTTDGGETWAKIYTGNWAVIDIKATDENTVYLLSYSTVYKSIDGGLSWKIVLNPDSYGSAGGFYFYNNEIGAVARDKGNVIKTTDGGQTWKNYTLPTDNDITNVFFSDENRGYATASGSNYLYGTVDGGQTWKTLSQNDLLNTGKIFFYPDGRGIIGVIGKYILYTRDYGKTTKLFLHVSGDIENYSLNINAVNDTTIMLSALNQIYKINFSKNTK